ncbi:MAG: phosphatase PAP2-related protein [Bacteriovorax sp.]|nr:phosphatase PAP2-related protein [Bacteriovorax sp.]
MRNRYIYFKSNWHTALRNRYFVVEFLISTVILVFIMLIFSKFTIFVEMRKGIQVNDPVLESFKAIDLTRLIFSMIYGGLLFALASLVSSPYRLMILFEAYALMVLTRIVMMFILPLSPPIGMILLQDPFVEFFGTGKTLVNDLFFSGHTATMFLLLLAVPKKLKWIFLIITILVAISVLIQKVHYTVDVLVAPYISFTCYHLILKFFYFRYKGESYDLEFKLF